MRSSKGIDLNVIAGHGRILAAKEEGITEVPCVFAEHLSEAQKRAYIIADNRLALNAGWDPEMLSVEIADLRASAFDLSILGFDDAELNKLMSGAEDVKDDDFDVKAELEKPAITQPGDLWILGPHRGWKKSGKHVWYSDRKQSTIWEFDKPRKNTDHPTMKPVPLLA